MKMIKNTMISRALCLVITMVFMITATIVPVYGVTENSNESESSKQVQNSAQEYEESASSWRYENGYNISEEEYQEDYREGPSMSSSKASFEPWSKTENGFINSKGKVIKGAIKKGVDVSSWQDEINWKKVKADGIDFAIIRCGFGRDKKSFDDTQWLRNVSECERLGIPYGVYLYSYASSESYARSEVEHTLRLLKEADADPDYPVYYDLEDAETRAKEPEEIVEYAQIFCSAIEAAGYEAGIYANYDWWTNVLYDIPKDPAFDQYDKWVAQYYYRCDYDEDEYRLWQCTSEGKVNGIDGNTDINFEFELENETNRTTDIWSTDEDGNVIYIDSEGKMAKSKWIDYRGNTYRVGSSGKRLVGRWYVDGTRYYFNKFGKLVKNSWVTHSGYKYYATADGSLAKGYKKIGNYYYLFNDNGVMRKGTVTVDGKQYRLLSSGKSCLNKSKIKTAVNYRTGPSTSYKRKGTYKKNKIVYVTRTSNGWSKLSTGYWVSSKYLKKVITYPKKIKSYKVKTTTAVNYRTGPSTSYKIKGSFKKGTVRTIIEEKNGWGKTSTGVWVKLSYTKKI